MTTTAAIQQARKMVSMYSIRNRNGSRQWVVNTWNPGMKMWSEGVSTSYAQAVVDARRSRIVCALVLLGVDQTDADWYAEDDRAPRDWVYAVRAYMRRVVEVA